MNPEVASFTLENAKRMAESIRRGDLLIELNVFNGQPLKIEAGDIGKIAANETLRPFVEYRFKGGTVRGFKIKTEEFNPEAYLALEGLTKEVKGPDEKMQKVRLFKTSVSEALHEKAVQENNEFDALRTQLTKYEDLDRQYREKAQRFEQISSEPGKYRSEIIELVNRIGELQTEIEQIRIEETRNRLKKEFDWPREPAAVVTIAAEEKGEPETPLERGELPPITYDLKGIENLKPTDVAQMDPSIVLGRMIADVKRSTLDKRVIPELRQRFGEVISADGVIDPVRLRGIHNRINEFWVESPLTSEVIPLAQIPALPESVMTAEDREEIGYLVLQADNGLRALADASGREIRSKLNNYAFLLRSVHTLDELREISDMLGDEYNAFRLISNGEALSREESFDGLVNAYGHLDMHTQQTLLDLVRQSKRQPRLVDEVKPNLEWLTHEVRWSVKPKMYQSLEKYGEFKETTIFDLAELAENKDISSLHQNDFERETPQYHTEQFLGKLNSSADKFADIDPAFKEFATIVTSAIEKEKKDYLQAVVKAYKEIKKRNLKGWEYMKQVARAVLHLEDIRYGEYRQTTKTESSREQSTPMIVLENVIPEVLAHRFLEKYSHEGDVIPDPFSVAMDMSDDQTFSLIGVNGSGKTTLLKAMTSPLPTIVGSFDEKGKFTPADKGITYRNALPAALLGCIEAEAVTDPNLSHMQRQVQLIRHGLLAARAEEKKVFMDERTGTTPDMMTVINATLKQLGISVSSHTPIPETQFLMASETRKRFLQRMKILRMHQHRLRVGEFDQLSGGVKLAALRACTPEFSRHLEAAASEMHIPLTLPPEYKVVASFRAENAPTTLPFVRDKELELIGLGQDGEVTGMASKLVHELMQRYKVPGYRDPKKSDQVYIWDRVQHQMQKSMPSVFQTWLAQPEKTRGRKNLMRLFLPEPGSKAFKDFFRFMRDSELLGDEAYFGAIDTRNRDLPEHYRMMGSISLLSELLQARSYTAVGVLEGIREFDEKAVARYSQKLLQTGFYSAGGQLILHNAASMLEALEQIKGARLENIRIREPIKIQRDVGDILRREIEYHAKEIVGFKDDESWVLRTIQEKEAELKLAEDRQRELAQQLEGHKKEFRGTVIQKFFEGISADERQKLEEIYSQINGEFSGSQTDLQAALEMMLDQQSTDKSGYDLAPEIKALYFVLSGYAGGDMLEEVIGKGFRRKEKDVVEGRRRDVDGVFRQVFWGYRSGTVERAASYPHIPDKIKTWIKELGESEFSQKSAASATGKLLGIVASRIPSSLGLYENQLALQTTQFAIDYATKQSRHEYTPGMSDFGMLLFSKSTMANESKKQAEVVKKLEEEIRSMEDRHAQVVSKYESVEKLKSLTKDGSLIDIMRTYKELREKNPLADERRIADIDMLADIVTAGNPSQIVANYVAGQLRTSKGERPKNADSVTTSDLLLVIRQLSSSVTPIRDALERYIARTIEGELRYHGARSLSEQALEDVDQEMQAALTTLGFATLARETGQFGEGKLDGPTVDIVDGLNYQVLARIGEAEAVRENHPSMSQRAKIRRAMRRYRPVSLSLPKGINFLSNPHGQWKTSTQRMVGQSFIYTSVWEMGPYKSLSSPRYAALRMQPDAGTGPNLSAHQSYVFEMTDIVGDARRCREERKSMLYLGDEVGQGTKPVEGRAEVTACLRTLGEYGVDANVISQDPDMVGPATEDHGIQAKIFGISPEGQLVERSEFLDPNPIATFQQMGFPPAFIALLEKNLEIHLRAKLQGVYVA